MLKIKYKEYEALYKRTRKMPNGVLISGIRKERIIFVQEPFSSEEELWEFAKEFEQKDFNDPDIHEELYTVKLK